ncbi:MAG: hypothetical protein ISS52_08220 [Dehalococcoidia bacterium]|nr:hypothetical protein [Dehalococcoidia bacterium]
MISLLLVERREFGLRPFAVVDRQEFERMKDEYYRPRGWDVATGLQTRGKLQELGLEDITDDLERRGLIAQRRS